MNEAIGFDRPTSWPFISGDGFRALAQHAFDEISDFDPAQVENNDAIFVRSDFVIDFFEHKHPHIKNKYIIITHNNDQNIDKSYERYIDEKVIHWFGQSVLFKHPKASPIPSGIQNLRERNNSIGKRSFFDRKEIKKDGPMSIRYGFSVRSNPERVLIEKKLEACPLAKRIGTANQNEYFEEVAKSYFLIGPPGRSIDCHRNWEAIYLKTVPIVLREPMTEYFKGIGLPMLLIDSWGAINDLTEEFLEKEYRAMWGTTNHFPQAFMDYWQKEIDSKRI